MRVVAVHFGGYLPELLDNELSFLATTAICTRRTSVGATTAKRQQNLRIAVNLRDG
jgi:hypothetical protein